MTIFCSAIFTIHESRIAALEVMNLSSLFPKDVDVVGRGRATESQGGATRSSSAYPPSRSLKFCSAVIGDVDKDKFSFACH